MIRSLYTRVVLIFLVSVIGGTILSFFVATWVFKDKLNENLKLPLLYFGQDIARIYETLPLHEAHTFVSGMKQLNSYHVRVYEESDQFQSYGTLGGHKPATVTMEQVKKILAGEVVQVNPSGISTTLLGLPFTTETGTKQCLLNRSAPLPPLLS